MSRKAEAFKKAFVALGFGEDVEDYNGNTVVDVLKELAVEAECATSVEDIHASKIVDVLEFIADNYGSEEKEPYDLTITEDGAEVTVKRGNKTLYAGTDQLYNGDKLKITAEPDDEGSQLWLFVNNESFESGGTITVNGHNINIVAEAGGVG